MTDRPSVLFVCVRNGGKSQVAAALLRALGPEVEVHSAGTQPGATVNALAAQTVREHGASMDGESPKALDPALVRRVDRVVVLGAEAVVEPVDGMRGRLERWETDEPSARGIEGAERMRLVCADIAGRVARLRAELLG